MILLSITISLSSFFLSFSFSFSSFFFNVQSLFSQSCWCYLKSKSMIDLSFPEFVLIRFVQIFTNFNNYIILSFIFFLKQSRNHSSCFLSLLSLLLFQTISSSYCVLNNHQQSSLLHFFTSEEILGDSIISFHADNH